MAKPLREPPPTSSVARLLDLGAAARAVAPHPESPSIESSTEHQTVPPPMAKPITGEPAVLKREFVLTESTAGSVDALIETFRRGTGTRLSASHVMRAVLLAVSHAMPQLESEARKVGVMKLPSNARGREGDRDRFERRIAAAIVAGFRSASGMEYGD